MPRGQTVEFTERQDEVIRKCWNHNSYGHHAAKRASELTGFSKDVCQRRAVQLGLIFARERFRWTEPELQVVEANAHLSLETIQRKLARGVSPAGVKRTRTAIMGQIYAQRFRTNLDGLNHGPLADALGISGYKLHTLRTSKLITGERLEALRQACGYAEEINEEHRRWFYSNEEIVRLLFTARGEVDLRKVNQTWLIGLLEPFITLFQPAEKTLPSRQRDQKRIEQLEDLLFQAEQEAAYKPVKRRRGRPTKEESAAALEETAAAMRQRMNRSIPLRPPARPGLLSDEAIAAIRARAARLIPRPKREPSQGNQQSPSGVTRSTQSSEVTGTTSNESAESSENLNSANGAATLPFASQSSGCAGAVSAG